MENKKKLKVDAAICDVRSVSEETLAAYERVSISCTTLISSPEARALLGRYQVAIDTASTLDVDGDARLSTFNGMMQITPSQTALEGKTILMVNGKVDIAPGCEEVLKSYAAIMVNGTIDVPESMAGLLTGATVNGTVNTYPDGCIRLKPTTVLDRTFPLRAKEGALYYAASRIVALSGDINFGKLTEKNVRFASKKLVVSEGLVEAALPLFDEKTDIEILPDGCAYVGDDAELNEALFRRRGGKLYVDGDLTLTEDGDWLDQVTYLRVGGDLLVARGLEHRLDGIDAAYENLYVVGGTVLTGKSSVPVSRDMLEGAEKGLSLIACAKVTVEKDVPVELLREKLVSVIACARVVCTEEQRAVIVPLTQATENIGPERDEKGPEEDSDVVRIGAAFYTL